MKNFRHIFVPIYRENIYWKRCSRSAFCAAILHEFKCLPSSTRGIATFGIYKKRNYDIGVIWIGPEAKTEHIIHECFHAVAWIMNERGVYLSESSDEAYACLLEYLCKSIL
jgi:hypothetical protein